MTDGGSRPLVVVPDYLDEVLPYARLRAEVEASGGHLALRRCQTQSDIMQCCSEAVALVVHWFPFERALLAALPRLQLIVRYGIGYDIVDVEAARELGIVVCNTPRFCIDEVADHTMALLLALARKLKLLTRNVESGRWDRDDTGRMARPRFRRLRGRTLGLIGFGRIGQAVALRARAFGLQMLACDPLVDPAQVGFPDVARATLEQALSTADFISLHVPLSKATRGLIGSEQFGLLKPDAVLINTSRGAVIDEEALIVALQSGRLAGAALDVLTHEPPNPANPLLHMEQVVVTPHYGAASAEALADQEEEASAAVGAILRGEWPPNVVNPGVDPKRPLVGMRART